MVSYNMNIGLCDDDGTELETLRLFVTDYRLQRHLSFTIDCFQSGEAILSAIHGGQTFGIIFLDIYMGGADGIAVAREIRKLDNDCAIVFETSSRERAIDGYGVRALQYLIKPLSMDAVAASLDQAMEPLRQKKKRYIQISNRQGNYKIAVDDILYAESNARVITVYLKDKEPMCVYERLDDFQKLCDDERFLRCHKSFLVNLDYVHASVRDDILMETGMDIHISMNVSEVKAAFASYMAKKI
jgi:two-component system, LytTR family, response regulator LytT